MLTITTNGIVGMVQLKTDTGIQGLDWYITCNLVFIYFAKNKNSSQ